MNFRSLSLLSLLRPFLLCAAFLCTDFAAFAQIQGVSTPVSGQNGFLLKKTTSNTMAPSGVNFSYTIDFTIPAGATSVTLTDVLPPALVYMAHSYTAPCGAPPTVSTPAVGANGTVSFSWASVPAGCTGSISITVQFPNGVTCNGETARNRVCLKGTANGQSVDFCTDFVTTTATAVNPWQISKFLVSNSSAPSCSNTAINDTVRYRLCVYKTVGTTGQLNLFNAVVTDVLPAGAVMVPGSATCPGFSFSGSTVTWNLGALSALPAYNAVCCDFLVYYPPVNFPNGTTITNSATLSGSLGSPAKPCGQFTQNSNTTSFKIINVAQSQLYKWVNTTGQPGCGGTYSIYICNNGAVTLSSFTITDNLPATLAGYVVTGNSSNISVSLSGSTLTATSTAALPPGGSAWVNIKFSIPLTATVGSTITNCATLSSPNLPNPVQACASFVVAAPKPKACVWKEVCQKQNAYLPGNTLTYRLRVQNIGGLAMTGTTVTDILSPYLTLVPGSFVYYAANTWNLPCAGGSSSLPAGATAWPGVTFSQSGQTLNWNLPPIAAVCQDLFYPNCGLYGNAGVPFYYIEFKVQINADAPIGLIPNAFTISGGNLPANETSNTDYINVTGTAGFTLAKSITTPATAVVSPGGTVNYHLQMNVSGSTALWHALFTDLLPKDASTDRQLLTPCAVRGSSIDVPYHSFIGATPAVTQRFEAANTANLNLTNITIPPVVGGYYPSSCGVPTAPWTNGAIAAGKKNIGFLFNTALSTSGAVDFRAQVPATAKNGDFACNTFAANAAKRFLINSSSLQYITGTEQESNKVCLKVEQQFVCDELIEPVFDPKCCHYSVFVQNVSGSPITQILYNTAAGTVQAAGASGCANTAIIGATAGNFNFSPACATNPQLYFDATGNFLGWVHINLTVIHQSGDTCLLSFKFKCKGGIVAERCDSISTKPFVYQNLNASGLTFTVHNIANPADAICSVGIQVGTLTGGGFSVLPWWLGGGLVLPNSIGVNATAQFNSIGGQYTQIPSNQPSINVPVNQTLQFNLGVDYGYVNTGTVAVVLSINHCNGTVCRDTIRWTTVKPCPDCPKIADGNADAAMPKIFAQQITLQGGGDLRPVKYIAFKIAQPAEAEIFAISAATLDGGEASPKDMVRLALAGQSAKTALFEFEQPLVLEGGVVSPKFNMVFAYALPQLQYILYDEAGNELGAKTLHLTSGTSETDKTNPAGGSFEVFPNPAAGAVNIRYELPSGGYTRIELYNANGQLLRLLDDGTRGTGIHELRFDLSMFPAGAYFVRLAGEQLNQTKALMLQE